MIEIAGGIILAIIILATLPIWLYLLALAVVVCFGGMLGIVLMPGANDFEAFLIGGIGFPALFLAVGIIEGTRKRY